MANSLFISPLGGDQTINGNVIITGQGLFADGSATLPSIASSTTPASGMYFVGGSIPAITNNTTPVVGFVQAGMQLPAASVLSWSTGAINAANDITLVRDATGTLAQKNAANAQAFRVYGNATGPKYLSLGHDGTNAVLDTASASGLFSIAPTNATSVTIGKKISSYVGVTTDGTLGVPIVTGGPTQRKVGATNAQTIGSFTVGAADATFRVSANILVTTATTHSFIVTCAYTDEGNTARTLTLNLTLVNGVFTPSIVNTAGAVPYMGMVQHIRCKAATTITIATSGSFTTVVYNGEGYITQIG